MLSGESRTFEHVGGAEEFGKSTKSKNKQTFEKFGGTQKPRIFMLSGKRWYFENSVVPRSWGKTIVAEVCLKLNRE